MMKGKKIVLGITGSIAAYKAAILTRPVSYTHLTLPTNSLV